MILSRHFAETSSNCSATSSIWNLVHNRLKFTHWCFLKPRSYRMNCYFYESWLIFIIRLYSQSPRFIIFPRSKTFSHRLFISVSFICINCYFYKSSLIFTFRYYSLLFDIIRRVLDTLFLRAHKCFLLIINAFCAITIIAFIIFKVFSQHLYLSNAPRAQRLILLSQFINYLKWFHAEISQSIACISDLAKGFLSSTYI